MNIVEYTAQIRCLGQALVSGQKWHSYYKQYNYAYMHTILTANSLKLKLYSNHSQVYIAIPL